MSEAVMMEAWMESVEPGDEPWYASGESAYHAALRSAMAPEYRSLPAERIDELVASAMQSMSVEDAESFGSFLSDLGRAVAPIAAKIVPIAAPIIGGAIGGPVGAAAGSALGGMAGQAIGGATAPPRPAPVRPPQPAAFQPPPRPSPPPMQYVPPPPVDAPSPSAPLPFVPPTVASMPAAPASASSALTQLATLLSSPSLLQSLAGQLLGAVGSSTVPVGPNGVPTSFASFMNALSTLANQAASESAERWGESGAAESIDYLRDDGGGLAYDPASPEERASALVAQLRAGEATAPWSAAEDVNDWLARAGLVGP